jgi:hypothetical protein
MTECVECNICSAAIPQGSMARHLEWHRTMTNLPHVSRETS